MNNKYIIKNLAPWMIDELVAFSKIVSFQIIFLRKQSDFYKEDIKQLEDNGVVIYTRPKVIGNLVKKVFIVLKFFFSNIAKFGLNYNGVIVLKSIWWFLLLDLSKFSKDSNIYAQFATQASLISLLIKRYYNNKPKFSFTFHAYDIYFKNRWFNLLVNNSHKAFSISKYNIEYVSKQYKKSVKYCLSRLGVNRNQISYNSKEDKVRTSVFNIGLLSWFVEKKGIIYLLEAMKSLKASGNHNIKLQIAGDGPLKEFFLNYIRNNNLEDSVEFIGKVKGKSKDLFFRSLDAFVLPSILLKNDQDGIPVVLMEAISYGLPIISTNVSGIPEICIDEYNGFLLPEKDSKVIFDSILRLKSSKELCNKFSNNSLKMSKKYDIDINSKRKVLELEW